MRNASTVWWRPPSPPSADDARAQLDRLVRPGFVTATGVGRLPDVLRYVKAIDHRLAKLPEDPHRDQARLRDVAALEQRYVALLRRIDRDDITAEVVDVGWLLEELRVSVFAQQLGTARPASPQKVSQSPRRTRRRPTCTAHVLDGCARSGHDDRRRDLVHQK